MGIDNIGAIVYSIIKIRDKEKPKMTNEQIMAKAKSLIKNLDWDGCVEAYNKLPKGNPIIDLVFDRMEEIDIDRFDAWL